MWEQAIDRLRSSDPRLAQIIDLVGPCTLAPRRDYFVLLCRAILGQQVSTKAAASMFARFRNLFPRRRPTPQKLLEALKCDDQCLRRCGFSRQKGVYVKDLADHFLTNQLPTRRLSSMTDDQIIEALTKVKGIGRWTAEMFLIFTLNRPDVLPVDDLGFQKGVQLIYGMRKHPTAKQLTRIAEKWKPWRSIGTWYVWRGLEKLGRPKAKRVAAAATSSPRPAASPHSPAPAPPQRSAKRRKAMSAPSSASRSPT